MSRVRAFPTVAVAAVLGVSGAMGLAPATASETTTTVATAPPEISLSDDKLSPAAFAEEGVEVLAVGLLPGQTIALEFGPAGEDPAERVTLTADDAGSATHTFLGEPDAAPGDYEVVAKDEEGEELAALPFTVAQTSTSTSASPSASESPSPSSTGKSQAPSTSAATATSAPSLAVEPAVISAADFVDQERGVRITVTGVEPGTLADLRVDSDAATVTSFTMTETADASGTAVFAVFGLNSARPDTYAGQYRVVVSGDGLDGLRGGFEVTGQPSDGAEQPPSDGGGDITEEPSSLPTTGAELAGVGLGLGLLVVGTMTIALSRRRARPGDIGDA